MKRSNFLIRARDIYDNQLCLDKSDNFDGGPRFFQICISLFPSFFFFFLLIMFYRNFITLVYFRAVK